MCFQIDLRQQIAFDTALKGVVNHAFLVIIERTIDVAEKTGND